MESPPYPIFCNPFRLKGLAFRSCYSASGAVPRESWRRRRNDSALLLGDFEFAKPRKHVEELRPRRFPESDNTYLLQDRCSAFARIKCNKRGADLFDLNRRELGRGDKGRIGNVPTSCDHPAALLFPVASHAGKRSNHTYIEKTFLYRPLDRGLIAHVAHLLLSHGNAGIAHHGIGYPPHVGIAIRRNDALAFDIGNRLER